MRTGETTLSFSSIRGRFLLHSASTSHSRTVTHSLSNSENRRTSLRKSIPALRLVPHSRARTSVFQRLLSLTDYSTTPSRNARATSPRCDSGRVFSPAFFSRSFRSELELCSVDGVVRVDEGMRGEGGRFRCGIEDVLSARRDLAIGIGCAGRHGTRYSRTTQHHVCTAISDLRINPYGFR